MEENKVLVSLDRYDQLLLAENQLEFLKQVIFNGNNRLTYDKKEICFEIEHQAIKVLFPLNYTMQLNDLQKKEGKNV